MVVGLSKWSAIILESLEECRIDGISCQVLGVFVLKRSEGASIATVLRLYVCFILYIAVVWKKSERLTGSITQPTCM